MGAGLAVDHAFVTEILVGKFEKKRRGFHCRMFVRGFSVEGNIGEKRGPVGQRRGGVRRRRGKVESCLG